ncbi:hypothetical protein RB614_11130 [Phytohabitans sp. ZYX-F-186]|uniref:Uncharacterized protein n=1 Tax=Phytohabitans maris TaxID=3071409 RepID=A0ABU0ZDE1_9ACTN|nr:hypothetical protein [Phytohabitans sp. ZYX-F-186]MDQ7905074.1 hypothetical protein [Phytohabitans sp. ZYX-F-186]
MDEGDPHIHVERRVVRADAAVRNLLASTFGLVADAPSTVTTGCGRRVPYAMTSPRPESVTCLACREHAHREHLRFADELEGLGRMAGSVVTPDRAAEAARHHRDLAARFAG